VGKDCRLSGGRTPGVTSVSRSRLAARVLALAVLAAAVPTLPGPATAVEPCAERRPTLVGTEGADRLTGTPGDDVIVGLGGDDRITGLGGDDVLCGGNGADLLLGDEGADVVRGGNGDDDVRGGLDGLVEDRGAGESRVGDTLYGGLGDDRLDGGEDPRDEDWFELDTVRYDLADSPVRVDLDTRVATGQGDDTLAPGRLAVVGSRFDDTLAGGTDDDTLAGGPGSDVLLGRAGQDTLVTDGGGARPGDADEARGGSGDDALWADAGPDRLSGGSGRDHLVDSGTTGADRVRGGAGDDELQDALLGLGAQALLGGPGLNRVRLDTATRSEGRLDLPAGEAVLETGARPVTVRVRSARWVHLPLGTWEVTGTAGPETVFSRGGPVRLDGRAGDDRLFGTRRDDVLVGGPGHDTARPRGGRDTCLSIETVETQDGGGCAVTG